MSMNTNKTRGAAVACLALLGLSTPASAAIDGIRGSTFSLTAKAGYVSIPDGASVYSWGYTAGNTMQLPGPTLIVTEGSTVSITLSNELPGAAGNTSIVFPGLEVTATGGEQGTLTREAGTGGTVTYTFTADQPGTYHYHSGSQEALQVEMGLFGALIVEPAATSGCTNAAYNNANTCFDREYLFVLSEIDLDVHQAAERQSSGAGPIELGEGPFSPEYWLLNGRSAPDTMAESGTATLPNQPYNSLPRMHPGERVLCRVVGAGRDSHPFHVHGNHIRVLARDGDLIVSESDGVSLAGPTLFTVPSTPGSTWDGIWEWTGKDLGWDMYGHNASDPLEPNEWAADHGKPIPVDLPELGSLAFGGFYGGSPYLGALGSLPPGEGGLNPDAGFSYMWHSHTERELVNNDIFPGGMMTMMIVVPRWVSID